MFGFRGCAFEFSSFGVRYAVFTGRLYLKSICKSKARKRSHRTCRNNWGFVSCVVSVRRIQKSAGSHLIRTEGCLCLRRPPWRFRVYCSSGRAEGLGFRVPFLQVLRTPGVSGLKVLFKDGPLGIHFARRSYYTKTRTHMMATSGPVVLKYIWYVLWREILLYYAVTRHTLLCFTILYDTIYWYISTYMYTYLLIYIYIYCAGNVGLRGKGRVRSRLQGFGV